MSNKLYEIADGVWVVPGSITAIVAYGACSNPYRKAKVVVEMSQAMAPQWECASTEEASERAAKIAARYNEIMDTHNAA